MAALVSITSHTAALGSPTNTYDFCSTFHCWKAKWCLFVFFNLLMIPDTSPLTFTDISLMLRSYIKQTIFAQYKYITDTCFGTVQHIQRHRNVVLRHHSGVQNFCTRIYLKANTCTNEISA